LSDGGESIEFIDKGLDGERKGQFKDLKFKDLRLGTRKRSDAIITNQKSFLMFVFGQNRFSLR
jgi:hypothetical protein